MKYSTQHFFKKSVESKARYGKINSPWLNLYGLEFFAVGVYVM
jgi:hypothetical protein